MNSMSNLRRSPHQSFGPMPTMTFLAGDASLRKYHRFWKDGCSYVLMDAPHPENPQRFCEVSDYLRSQGFSAPQVLQKDLEQGYLTLEDFGDQTFTRYLDSGKDPIEPYTLAIDVLISLHKKAQQCPHFLQPYSLDLLLKEVEAFLEWYCPHNFKQKISKESQSAFLRLWTHAFQQALTSPSTIVLRDFHVDNLMWLEHRSGLAQCGLLDFQDAVWGPKVYDIVSLVEDARRDIAPDLITSLWDRYFSAFPEEDSTELMRVGSILSAGRHLKIMGYFTRLHIRDGKSHYLKHIPRVKGLLDSCLKTQPLSSIREWFKVHAD